MIRAARLAPSRPMYAFDPVTFARPHPDEDEQYGGCRTIAAVRILEDVGFASDDAYAIAHAAGDEM